LPVCDPRLPPPFRRWALRQWPVFDSRGELAILVPGGSSGGGRLAAVCCWLAALACVALLVADPLPGGRGVWLAAAVGAAIAAAAIQYRSRRYHLRQCRSKVIFPESLDGRCRGLLGRGQAAMRTIRGSDVRAAGLLENPVYDEMLRQHEWEIASRLRQITSLRALLAASTLGGQAGPMTADVLGAQQRAIELAQEATAARVRALERYAGQVIAADDANRDWEQASKLSALNDKYLDLVASTASDEYAAGEITDLTGQLAAAARARNDRLREADLAAAVLVLPPGQAHRGDSIRDHDHTSGGDRGIAW